MSSTRETAGTPLAQPPPSAREIGVLVFAADGSLAFASADAFTLLDSADDADFTSRWQQLHERARDATRARDPRTGFDTEVGAREGARALRCELQRSHVERDGAHALVVRELALARDAEREQLDAARFRVLARLQRAVEHELRDPMNAIGLSLELLVDDVRAGTPAEAGTEESVRTLRRDFLAFSATLQAFLGRTRLSEDVEERLDLRALARELTELLAALAKQRCVALSVVVPAASVERVGSRARLELACALLAIDVIDALGPGSALELSVDARGQMSFTASIADELARAELVERWNRAFTQRAAVAPGGLHVALRLVEDHGGRVLVETREAPALALSLEFPAPEATV